MLMFVGVFYSLHSKMINLSVPDTIDERTINKKKLTPFTIQVSQFFLMVLFSPSHFLANVFVVVVVVLLTVNLCLTGESKPGPELCFSHRVPCGEHRCFRPERREAPSGVGPAVADHQDRSLC